MNDERHTSGNEPEGGRDGMGRASNESGEELLRRVQRLEERNETMARVLEGLDTTKPGTPEASAQGEPSGPAGTAEGGGAVKTEQAGQEAGDTPQAPDLGQTRDPQNVAADPSRWSLVDDKQRRTWWRRLAEWVDWLAVTYDLQTESRTIPPCWWQHPAAAQELAALWQAHRGAYSSKAAAVEPARWHLNLLWPMVQRLTEHRTFASCTLNGHRSSSLSRFNIEVPPSASSKEFAAFVDAGAPGGPARVDPAWREPGQGGEASAPLVDVTELEELPDDAGHVVAPATARGGGARNRPGAEANRPRVEPVRARTTPGATARRLGRPTPASAPSSAAGLESPGPRQRQTQMPPPASISGSSTVAAPQVRPARATASTRSTTPAWGVDRAGDPAPLPAPARPARTPSPWVSAPDAAAADWPSPSQQQPLRPLSELTLNRKMVDQMLITGNAVGMLDDVGSPLRVNGTWWTTSTPHPGPPQGDAGDEPLWTAVADQAVNAQLEAMWSHQLVAGHLDDSGEPAGGQA